MIESLKIDQVAERYDVHSSKVRGDIKSGKLPAKKIANSWRVPVAAAEREYGITTQSTSSAEPGPEARLAESGAARLMAAAAEVEATQTWDAARGHLEALEARRTSLNTERERMNLAAVSGDPEAAKRRNSLDAEILALEKNQIPAARAEVQQLDAARRGTTEKRLHAERAEQALFIEAKSAALPRLLDATFDAYERLETAQLALDTARRELLALGAPGLAAVGTLETAAQARIADLFSRGRGQRIPITWFPTRG